MTKNRNRSGFTLVELIVVMAIISIFFGAIWRFLQPTSEMYDETSQYQAQQSIVWQVQGYLDSELRYSMDTLILVDYAGRPKLNAIDPSHELYNSCIVIDESTPRTNDAALNLGATGSLLRYVVSVSGYSNKTEAIQNDLLDKYFFQFNFKNFDTTDSIYGVNIGIQSFDSAYKSGSWVMNTKPDFEANATIAFDNINATGGTAYYKDAATDANIYITYPQDSTPTDKVYTYIFYKKLNYGAIAQEDQKYQVIFKNKDGTTISTQDVLKHYAAVLPETVPSIPDGTDRMYEFETWDGTGDYTNVTADLTFTAKYKEILYINIPCTVEYYGISGNLVCSIPSHYKADVSGNSSIPDLNDIPDEQGWDKRWQCISGTPTLNELVDNVYYQAQYYNEYTVTFQNGSSTIGTVTVDRIKTGTGIQNASISEAMFPAAPTNAAGNTATWVWDHSIDLNNITSDIIINAQF